MTGGLEHLDDPFPPRAGAAEQAAAVMRGAALRRRRRTTWIGSGVAAVAAVVALAMIAGTSGDGDLARLTPADGSLSTETPSSSAAPPSPSDVATPSAEPASAEPSSSVTAAPATPAARAVQPLLGPEPQRKAVVAPDCPQEQQVALSPPTVALPDGIILNGNFEPGGLASVKQGEEWSATVSVVNRSGSPFSFTETAPPVVSVARDDEGPPLGGGTDANPAHGSQTIPPEGHVSWVVRVTTLSCTDGRPLPSGTYRMRAVIRTDRGAWATDFGVSSAYVFAADGDCFPEPALQSTPPVDGLTMSVGAHPLNGDNDFAFPWSDFYTVVTITNSTDDDVRLVQVGHPVTYIGKGGKVTGGWFTDPGRHVVPDPMTIPAHGSRSFEIYTAGEGCTVGAVQEKGMRDVVVGLHVERDGVGYHWKGRGSNLIHFYGGYGE